MKAAIDPETGEGMLDKEIRDEALNFLMAGHETTENGLVWTLYLLAKHPAIEAQVRDEIRRVCGDRLLTVADIPQLQRLDRVLKESLRLYPPAWLLGRTPLEPVTVAGYTLEPESNLVLSPYVIHRNPRYFPEPEAFNPDRFLVEPVKYSYLPFGVGPHMCIGQAFATLEMTLTLVVLLQHYQFILPEGYLAEPEPMMTLRPKGGLRMELRQIARTGATHHA